ncbi:G5 and 3D domain-containing protein [Evansella cellulosilytica]|uniref:G5 domain protein n=1 Tax=Evansella cellulosilytica (strain ATCC 21833 / DSM 2522 / FERM P-1141 / JCM 9156 / N-4) TaxID=649639 RepID=E6TRN8_EVAC2|nr:G5 and 3D domain-containing protein [Evansella cellulosilytica]ADU28332.1 G5 domain protein [Evansella cellulosilytica DSM 2522]
MTQWMKQFFSRLSWRKFAISSVGLLTLMGILVFAIYEATKISVTVEVDDEQETIYTHASTVGEVLKERGIEVGVHDYIEPSLDTVINDATEIVYIPAQQVIVTIDGNEEEVWTIASNVKQLLDELDVEVNEHDVISPSLHEAITSNMTITYEEAFKVIVHSDGEEKEFWTTSTTVADFLERENFTLGELDRVEPSLEEKLDEEVELNVVRVEKVTDVVEETVDFATVRRNDSSLEQGSEEVVQNGQEGRIEKHYEVIFEDGEEVSRELVKEEKVRDSEDRIVAVGTKAPQQTVSRSASSDSASGDWQTFTATAYSAYCNGCSGNTATGLNLRANPDKNVIAVDPNVIPLGSRVEIKGMGTFLAADTGGAINGRIVDIFMPDPNGATTNNRALSFGRQTVELRILD